MTDGEELHEFHIDQFRPGTQSHGKTVPTHISGGRIAVIQPRQSSGGDHRSTGGDCHRLAGFEMQSYSAQGPSVLNHQVYYHEVREPSDIIILARFIAQSSCGGWACVQKINIDTAITVVAWRMGLGNAVTAFPVTSPPHAPIIHLSNSIWCRLAQNSGQRLIHQPSTSNDCIRQVKAPMILLRFADRRRNRHLRHYRGPRPSHHALIQQQDADARFGSGDGGVHTGPSCSDDQDISLKEIHHKADGRRL